MGGGGQTEEEWGITGGRPRSFFWCRSKKEKRGARTNANHLRGASEASILMTGATVSIFVLKRLSKWPFTIAKDVPRLLKAFAEGGGAGDVCF